MTTFSREKINVGILAASQTFLITTSITVMILSGMVGLQLAPDPQLSTLPVAMMMIGAVISALPASLFMKRVGRKTGFMVGTSLGIAGGVIAFFSIMLTSFWLFCLGNLVLGFYQGFATYYRFAAVDASSEAFRSRALSYVLAGGIVAAFLGPWNARLLTDLITDVPMGAPYLVVAALALASTLLLMGLKMPPAPPQASSDIGRSLLQIMTQPVFIVALLAGALGYAIMVLVMTATPLAMKSQGYGMADIAFVMRWHVLGMFIPSLFTGTLIAKFGVTRMLLSGVIMLVSSALVAVLGSTLSYFWVALVLLGLGWNFLFVGASVLLTSAHTEAEKGKVQGLNDLVIFSFSAMGSLLAGTLWHHVGWETLNLLMLPLVAVVLVAIAWLKMFESKRQLVSA